MLTRITVGIIFQCTQILSHFVVHLKLISVNYILTGKKKSFVVPKKNLQTLSWEEFGESLVEVQRKR